MTPSWGNSEGRWPGGRKPRRVSAARPGARQGRGRGLRAEGRGPGLRGRAGARRGCPARWGRVAALCARCPERGAGVERAPRLVAAAAQLRVAGGGGGGAARQGPAALGCDDPGPGDARTGLWARAAGPREAAGPPGGGGVLGEARAPALALSAPEGWRSPSSCGNFPGRRTLARCLRWPLRSARCLAPRNSRSRVGLWILRPPAGPSRALLMFVE